MESGCHQPFGENRYVVTLRQFVVWRGFVDGPGIGSRIGSGIAARRVSATNLTSYASTQSAQAPTTSTDGLAPADHTNRHTRNDGQHDKKSEDKRDKGHSETVNLVLMMGV